MLKLGVQIDQSIFISTLLSTMLIRLTQVWNQIPPLMIIWLKLMKTKILQMFLLGLIYFIQTAEVCLIILGIMLPSKVLVLLGCFFPQTWTIKNSFQSKKLIYLELLCISLSLSLCSLVNGCRWNVLSTCYSKLY